MDDCSYSEDIDKSIEVLKSGGIILYPTDTIWGIGCDPFNENAVRRIYEIKRRADSKSMLCLIDNMDRISSFVDDIPDIAYQLNDLAIRPITIIYEGAFGLAPSMLNEEKTIGIRVTKELFSNELCRKFKKPIVSTSANISGMPSPSTFKEISCDIIKNVDYVVNYRQNDIVKHQSSQIIMIKKDLQVKVIRE